MHLHGLGFPLGWNAPAPWLLETHTDYAKAERRIQLEDQTFESLQTGLDISTPNPNPNTGNNPNWNDNWGAEPSWTKGTRDVDSIEKFVGTIRDSDSGFNRGGQPDTQYHVFDPDGPCECWMASHRGTWFRPLIALVAGEPRSTLAGSETAACTVRGQVSIPGSYPLRYLPP